MRSVQAVRTIEDPCARFRALSELYAEYLAREGVQALPYRSAEIPEFKSMSREEQSMALDQLLLASEVFEEIRLAGQSIRDSKGLLWKTLGKLKLTPRPDIFDKIAPEDVVELYSIQHAQIFRNIRFFELSTFTVEEIFGALWFKKILRAPEITARIFEIVKPILNGELDATIATGLPETEIQELTPGRPRFRNQVEWFSPVKRDGKTVGAIVLSHGYQIQGGHL